MTDAAQLQSRKQAVRLRRFLLASTTYALGLLILALCSAFGLLAVADLARIGLSFLAANLVFYAVFRSGWNLRFADPSLTQVQVCVAACLVGFILVWGEHVHFVAVPFYSSIFVFAMLQLNTRQLVAVELFVLGTYGVAIALRMNRYGGSLDLRIEAIDAAVVVLCSIWFAFAASYISNLRERLRESKQTIEALATRDAMTDTWNRRHIDALLASELQRKERIGGQLCVALIDLDHFKSVNDRYGHLTGDAVLQQVAHAMKQQLRSVDPLGRFGGEEFLALLPGASLPDARACAERLLRGVAGLSVLPDAASRVTISIGLAEAVLGEPAEGLLARADGALYRAKHEGRNRVELALRAVH